MSSRFVVAVASAVFPAWLFASAMVGCQRKDRATKNAPVLGAVLTAGTDLRAESGEPRIDFDTRVHDFGLVNEGKSLKHVFAVRNTGTAGLVLSAVRTSCGCTAATPGATTIPPGGESPLEVTMDTHGAQGTGRRSITITSNDPRQSTSILEIAYDVQRLLSLDRTFVQLTSRRGSDRTESVWLMGRLVGQARPRIDVTGTNLVTARPVETREGGERRKGVRLTLHANRPAKGDGVVTIKTGLPDPPELSLPFRFEAN